MFQLNNAIFSHNWYGEPFNKRQYKIKFIAYFGRTLLSWFNNLTRLNYFSRNFTESIKNVVGVPFPPPYVIWNTQDQLFQTIYNSSNYAKKKSIIYLRNTDFILHPSSTRLNFSLALEVTHVFCLEIVLPTLTVYRSTSYVLTTPSPSTTCKRACNCINMRHYLQPIRILILIG